MLITTDFEGLEDYFEAINTKQLGRAMAESHDDVNDHEPSPSNQGAELQDWESSHIDIVSKYN